MAPYNARVNTCGHPEKRHHAKGMCHNCYHAQGNIRQYRKDYANSNARRDILKHRYGITVEEYDQKNKKQHGLCAICGQPPRGRMRRLSVDHDHTTGKFRGLLCITCNRVVGYIENDEWLNGALGYLNGFSLNT